MNNRHSKFLVTSLAVCSLMNADVFATDMSSANYSIKWDVTDGGGGNSTSANYIVETSTGQSTAIGESSSTNYTVVAGFKSIPDSDADGILDSMDNCTHVPNPSQCDGDNDGYGNNCDADFNNDLIVNNFDVGPFKAGLGTTNPVTDLNCDGITNNFDVGPFKAMLGTAPGPSGLVP
jgi:hypothetical protein